MSDDSTASRLAHYQEMAEADALELGKLIQQNEALGKERATLEAEAQVAAAELRKAREEKAAKSLPDDIADEVLKDVGARHDGAIEDVKAKIEEINAVREKIRTSKAHLSYNMRVVERLSAKLEKEQARVQAPVDKVEQPEKKEG